MSTTAVGSTAETAQPRSGSLRRNLSIWGAIGVALALMAPSMAANINPQGTAGLVGRATPLAFLLAAIAVLLIAYVFVRLCQYYNHAGSVYVFAGATLGARAGAVAGLGLMGTYVFYGLVTASASGSGGGGRRPTTGCLRGVPCVRARVFAHGARPGGNGISPPHRTWPSRSPCPDPRPGVAAGQAGARMHRFRG